MQPISAFEQKKITQGDGTTLIRDASSIFKNMWVPVSTAGTVIFYDTNATTGTAATNEIFRVPTIQGTPQMWEFNWTLKKGLVAVTSGTVNFNVGVL